MCSSDLAYNFSGLNFGDACMFEVQEDISSPTEEAMLNSMVEAPPSFMLTVDSGCTQHTIDDESVLDNIVPHHTVIRTAKDGVVMESLSKGDLALQSFTTKGTPVSLVLHDVICIQKQGGKSPLVRWLLSVTAFSEDDLLCAFAKDANRLLQPGIYDCKRSLSQDPIRIYPQGKLWSIKIMKPQIKVEIGRAHV